MPEDTIDGTNLPSGLPEQAETVTEKVQTAPAPPEPVKEIQPPQTNIPEQYRDKSADELIYELQKRDSILGRYKAEVGSLRQVRQAFQQPVYTLPPSSLPRIEALGQQGQSGQPIDLNDRYFEKPAEVIRQIVNEGIQTYEQKQVARQYQSLQERLAWINRNEEDELVNLRLEEDMTKEHEALMEALAKRDAELINKLHNDPSLTEQQIRDTVKNLFIKADKLIKGQLQDPEKIRALNEAQKFAAANSAPSPRAAATGTQAETEQDLYRKALAERGWGHLLKT